MRFGVSYNIFNGEEHLIPSIKSIRDSVDYINLVVQYVSNNYSNASEKLFEVLKEIRTSGLVNEIIEYTPTNQAPQLNEYQKRVIGFNSARDNGIDYFATMDADEYYFSYQLNQAKRFLISNSISCAVVPTFLHIKRPIYRSKLRDTTDVCFFTRINHTTKLAFGAPFNANVDPTRRLITSDPNLYFFKENELAMMHMNLVRQDHLKSKLENTPSSKNTKFIKAVKKAYETWEYGNLLEFPGKPQMEIIKVQDFFQIDHLF